MLNRIHSPQNCLSSLWDKSFLQERGIASFFLTEKNTFENTPLFDGIFRYLLIQKGTAQITITGLEYFLKPSCLVVPRNTIVNLQRSVLIFKAVYC